MNEVAIISEQRAMAVLEALDALALALADHDHKWTDSERHSYESAVALVISWCRTGIGLSAKA